MKRADRSWASIAVALRDQGREGTAPRDRASFWEDFEARARMCSQVEPWGEWAGQRGADAGWARWAVRAALAALLVVAAGSGLWMVRGGAGASQTGGIRDVRVLAPHSAVMIIEDGLGEGRILWVAEVPDEGRL